MTPRPGEQELVRVRLRGGSADGHEVLTSAPPAAHRVYFDRAGRRWSELYLYVHHGGRDPLPDGLAATMHFMEIRDEA